MKTLKLGLAAIALLFVSAVSNAAEKVKGSKMNEDAVVNTYIDAISTGNIKSLDKILDDNMQFNLQRGENVNTLNKGTLLRNIETTVAVALVNTSTSVMQSDDISEKVKITFNYDGYTRTDIVTLNKTSGWSITNIISTNK